MEVKYISCSSCGFEDFDTTVIYNRTTATGDLYLCPSCGEETSDVDLHEDDQD